MGNEGNQAQGNRLAEFASRLEINKRYYAEEDPANKTLGVFAEAALRALDEAYFRQLIGEVFEFRPDMSATYAVKLLERVYQADLLEHDPDYPKDYQSIDAWLEAFAVVHEDRGRGGAIWRNLMHNNLQSNVAERYKTIKLLAATLQDRFDQPPSHLDVGSSVLHGDIKLAYNRMEEPMQVPFGLIEVTGPSKQKDPYLSALANTALKQHVEFGPMMGVDITDVDDPATKQWVKSCSFYPDELLDKKRVAEYDELDQLDPNHDRVQVFRGDFAHLNFKQFREVSPVSEYDIITFSTIFYQVHPHERTRMLVNASQLLAPRGIIIIQDGVGGDFSKRYNYVTSVIDNTQRHPTEQTLLRWETPRCQKTMLAMGQVSVGGKLRTFEKVLLGAR